MKTNIFFLKLQFCACIKSCKGQYIIKRHQQLKKSSQVRLAER